MVSGALRRAAAACRVPRSSTYHSVPPPRTTDTRPTLLAHSWRTWRRTRVAGYARRSCAMSSAPGARDDAALKEQKAAARKDLKSALRASTPEDLAAQSSAIATHVMGADFFRKSSVVAVYLTAPKLREVETKAIAESLMSEGSGKRCYVPVVMDSDSNMQFLHIENRESLVEMPPFGILEPQPQYKDGSPRQDVLDNDQPLDLILMPGLGFDRDGGRLGRGGGYYDKFLEKVASRAKHNGWEPPVLVALAFRQQILQQVPMSEHDQRIHFLVTEDGVHKCPAHQR